MLVHHAVLLPGVRPQRRQRDVPDAAIVDLFIRLHFFMSGNACPHNHHRVCPSETGRLLLHLFNTVPTLQLNDSALSPGTWLCRGSMAERQVEGGRGGRGEEDFTLRLFCTSSSSLTGIISCSLAEWLSLSVTQLHVWLESTLMNTDSLHYSPPSLSALHHYLNTNYWNLCFSSHSAPVFPQSWLLPAHPDLQSWFWDLKLIFKIS